MENSIPCEFCGDLVVSQLYQQHAYRCRGTYNSEVMDDSYFDNDNIIGSYIRHNYQVHRINIRDFIETHSSPTSDIAFIHQASPSSSSPKTIKTPNIKDINNVSIIVTNIDTVDELCVCPICQTEIHQLSKDGIRIRKLECLHMFCHSCINKWFEKSDTCPICNHIFKN